MIWKQRRNTEGTLASNPASDSRPSKPLCPIEAFYLKHARRYGPPPIGNKKSASTEALRERMVSKAKPVDTKRRSNERPMRAIRPQAEAICLPGDGNQVPWSERGGHLQ